MRYVFWPITNTIRSAVIYANFTRVVLDSKGKIKNEFDYARQKRYFPENVNLKCQMSDRRTLQISFR